MAETRPASKTPDANERRQLLLRGGVAAAVIGVLLVALLMWERTPSETADVPVAKPVAVPTPQQIRAASGDAAPVAQSAAQVSTESSAPTAQSAPVPSPSAAASEPVTSDAEEETRGVTTEPPKDLAPKEVAPKSRQAGPSDGAGGRVHLQAPEPGAGARLVVQTEPAPPGAKPPAGRAFALQAGVFSTQKNAEDLRARLELAGIPAQIETRVVVGPFRSRTEAEQAQSKLKALGLARGQLVTVRQP